MAKAKLVRCRKKQVLCHPLVGQWCNADSKYGYSCSRKRRHKGNHVACIINQPWEGSEHNLEVWGR